MSTIRDRIAAVPFARRVHGQLVKWTVRSGALDLLHLLTGRRHVILTFHRIRPTDQPRDPFDTCPSTSVDAFRAVLEYAKERYTVMPLHELCDSRAGSEPGIAITFDDGWRDNYDWAFPVLRELDIPATIFVTTGKIGGSTPFWQQILGRRFRRAAEQHDEPATRELRAMLHLPADRTLTFELYRKVVLGWKHSDGRAERERCVARLENATPADSGDSRCFLNAEEIREMSAAGVAFGSHTVTHSILPQLSLPEIASELTTSKSDLEKLLGHEVDAIAYPDGQYSHEVLQCAGASGYQIGCTAHSGMVAAGNNSMCLPRVDASFGCISDGLHFDAYSLIWGMKKKVRFPLLSNG